MLEIASVLAPCFVGTENGEVFRIAKPEIESDHEALFNLPGRATSGREFIHVDDRPFDESRPIEEWRQSVC